MIDDDQFESWLAHPVTEILLQRCNQSAERSKHLWVQRSWEAGQPEVEFLARLKGQAEAFQAISQNTKEWLEDDE